VLAHPRAKTVKIGGIRMTDQIVTIDPEFESFLPPLKEHEYEKLKKSILADGLRQPITIWKGEGLIVDGHNRYRICMENGMEHI
jgi:ParB-like chromosome segregation protein Spo0J